MNKLLIFITLLITHISYVSALTYPAQEVNFGLYNTNRNMNITGLSDGSAMNSWVANGVENEDWRIDYISAGVYEIVNAASGLLITDNGGLIQTKTKANNNSQRWNIVGTDKDFLGEFLYYKITNVSTGKALTFSASGNVIISSTYSGADFQKWRIDLDGLEGFAALCKVKEGVKASAIGGLLGPTVFVSTLTELQNAVFSDNPTTVVVTANMDAKNLGKVVEIGSYTTVIGSFAANEISDIQIRNNSYGWNYNGTYTRAPGDNIIYKNMKFSAKVNEDDILVQLFSCKNIWLDHITFDSKLVKNQGEVGKFVWINTPYSGPDQNINPDFITVSYSTFTNRYWCFAYGTQNTTITENRTTVAHNVWDSNIRRTPQIGNGTLHNYNNYYVHNTSSEENDGYATVIGGEGSTIYSESNRFDNFRKESSGYWDIEFTVGTGHLFVDYGSYTNKSASGSSSVVPYLWSSSTVFTKVTWDPNTNYSYKRSNSYNSAGTLDTKAFTKSYSGSQSSQSNFKYITDSDMSSFVVENIANPFLTQLSLNPVKFVYEYDNSGNADWENTNSWTPSGTPSSIDTAIIKTGEVKINSDINSVVKVEADGVFRMIGYFNVPTLVLQGGTLKVYTSGTTYGINSSVKVEKASTIMAGSTTASPFLCDAVFSGSENLTKTSVGILQLQKSSPNFSGDWIVSEGKLRTRAAHSVGSGNVRVNGAATLDLEVVSGLAGCDTLLLESGATVTLDAAIDTVKNLKINGVAIAKGSYNSSNFPEGISGVGTLVVLNGDEMTSTLMSKKTPGVILEVFPNPMTANGGIKYSSKFKGDHKLVIYSGTKTENSKEILLQDKYGIVSFSSLDLIESGVYVAILYHGSKEIGRINFYY